MNTATSTREPPEALDEAVHVWLCRPGPPSPEPLGESCRAVLSEDERRRADRLRRTSDRRTFEVAHSLIRHALSLYADVPASAWSFRANRWGRPEIAGPAHAPRFAFSLSHTRGLVACAITAGGACGIDVESFERGGNPLRVARRVLSGPELADLEAQPAEAKLGRFLEYWTLKEAYLKARGVGLSVAMREVSFALGERGIRLAAVDPGALDGPAAWAFASERPTPTHALALALGPPDGPSRTIVMREGLPRVAEC